MDSYAFYGADHMLFGTDEPLGPKWAMIHGTIESFENMNITEAEKKAIYRNNAIKMFNMVL